MDLKTDLCCSLIILACIAYPTQAQIALNDSSKTNKIEWSAYIDTYWAIDRDQSKQGERPYAVSSHQLNQFSINLAYVSLRYNEQNVRFVLSPAVGSYMNANYLAEPGSLKLLLEANAGVCLSTKKSIWLDAGVFGSPYTFESPISRDQISYSRSMSAEFSPYYLSGLRLSIPISQSVKLNTFLINGWQQIKDRNNEPSLGTQLEIKPDNHLTISWSNYVGNEQEPSFSNYRYRYFTDLYLLWSEENKWTFATGVYAGKQQLKDSIGLRYRDWWQANLQAKYHLSEKLALNSRLEFFHDPYAIVAPVVNQQIRFSVWSFSSGLQLGINKNALCRVEARYYEGPNRRFERSDGNFNTSSLQLFASFAVWL